ncbi:MAG: Gfo/Idh/MocA family oxidoreductase [Deltaproteobacteria bacterium]|nr:Gfo/Idh/MocA family oxidoreductase [Deltaproteobacteria bacterium]
MTRPRIGFLGVGWLGRNRLEAIVEHGLAEVAAIADPSPARRAEALALAPGAIACEHAGQLLQLPLDGVVIATPSALHTEHSLSALARGRAVFCQKPLARTADETELVVDAARASDRLLAVDLAYRHTAAMRAVRDVVAIGELGRIHTLDLAFHSAYGPDAPWCYDKQLSGGGCVVDLGTHLVDLALWLLDFPALAGVDSRLVASGAPIDPAGSSVEDFASVHLHLAGGVLVRLVTSWRASVGRDAVIEVTVHGTDGGAALRNVGGSFCDFVGERYRGARVERLTSPPDRWRGRAAVAWVERLTTNARFDAEADRLVELARIVDAIYQRNRTIELRGVA